MKKKRSYRRYLSDSQLKIGTVYENGICGDNVDNMYEAMAIFRTAKDIYIVWTKLEPDINNEVGVVEYYSISTQKEWREKK